MEKVNVKAPPSVKKNQHPRTKKIETPACRAIISATKASKIETHLNHQTWTSHTFIVQQKKQLSYFLEREDSDIDNALFTIKKLTQSADT